MVLQRGCSRLPSYQQCRKVHFFPHLLLYWWFVEILMVVTLTGMRWYFILVLIYISLIMSDVEQLFMCVRWTSVCLLWKNLFSPLAHFLIGLLIFLVFNFMSCLHILEINSLSVTLFTSISPQSESCLSHCL